MDTPLTRGIQNEELTETFLHRKGPEHIIADITASIEICVYLEHTDTELVRLIDEVHDVIVINGCQNAGLYRLYDFVGRNLLVETADGRNKLASCSSQRLISWSPR